MGGIGGNDFFLGDISVHSGSIIIEGTISGKSDSVLKTAEQHIYSKAMESSQILGINFEFAGGCEMMTHSNRDVNKKSTGGNCYDGPGSNLGLTSGLQAWAVALIVICVLIFVTLMVFIFICMKNRNSEYINKA